MLISSGLWSVPRGKALHARLTKHNNSAGWAQAMTQMKPPLSDIGITSVLFCANTVIKWSLNELGSLNDLAAGP